MSKKVLQVELERRPFQPLRLHMSGGEPITVRNPGAIWLVQNTVMVLRHHMSNRLVGDGYDAVALQNVERINH